jgi:hypothetical protein
VAFSQSWTNPTRGGIVALTSLREPRSRSAQELFVLFVPAIAMFALTVYGERLVIDGDVFWHIAAGEWMIDQRAIIGTDPFSYTFAGQPWHAHEWLSEILMAATYRAAGWNGLYVLAGLAFGATAVLLARHLLLADLEPVPALYLSLFALADIKGWVMMRPHLFALPILVVWTGELLAARRESRAPRWFLAPLMVLWVNLHPSFLFGAALIAVFGLEAVLKTPREGRRIAAQWGARFIGVILAAMVNPAGAAGVSFPLMFTAAGTAAMIPEWRTTMFNTLGPFEISLLAGVLGCLFLGVRMTAMRLILLAGMLHLTLAHQRFVIVLAIVGAMILAEPIAKALREKGWRARPAEGGVNALAASAGAVLIALVLAASSFAIPRGLRNETITPLAALAHVPAEIAARPVFNDWLIGGYLIFTGMRPYIDGRAELYGAGFIRTYLQIVRPDAVLMRETFVRYGVVWTLLAPGNRAMVVLDLMPEWCRVYRDDAAVVHVRRNALAGTNVDCQN